MEVDLFILLLFLIPILTIGIPIILSIWIYRILKKKDINPKWKILALIPILIVGYFVYDAFYPSSDFYKYDFKEVTGIELPENSEFEYKTASYPDLQGDYTSVSIIKVGTEFYKDLQTELIKNKLFENGKRLGHNEMDNAKRNMNELKIEREFSKQVGGVFYYVAFLSDKKTILVQRSSH
jgi:hypothetical protein